MKKFVFVLQLLCMLYALQVSGQPKEASTVIEGIYWSPKKDAKIQIYRKGTKYFGKTVWLTKPGKDIKNPVAALRERALLGLELLSNFEWHDDEYSGGKIYDPESGKTYDCKMALNGDVLKVRGYIGISMLGRTERFVRVQ